MGTQRLPEFDEDGLLKYPGQWSQSVARAIAQTDGIGELTEEHWGVINRMRTEYMLFGTVLSVRRLSLGEEREKRHVHELFQSYLEAWRLSGLPNPGGPARRYLERA
ncbi:sulfur relay protein TusE [Sulfurifustis variabilis]|uniref:Sulfur relay protein TusE n=1 Tax=Sulfurifustis variabilis TaxID=1675686 RepID=A0A1B4V0N9_9GAMM|nr:TusE/DsrC/DsvC family sulfur relay protein [Sulfurifustis variabilis]BAU46863.1 sulfur relay protein TusE [Sulfurifustis variabilis]